ncbi:hypothetical protein [Paraprevotella clara]|uniref:hypothetical protein n=1 Tax=Paraprevotella clara TaxID=454154 RepID=UPI00300F24D2
MHTRQRYEQIVDVGISAFSATDFHYKEVYDEFTNEDFTELPEPGNPTEPVFEKVKYPVPAEQAATAIVPWTVPAFYRPFQCGLGRLRQRRIPGSHLFRQQRTPTDNLAEKVLRPV